MSFQIHALSPDSFRPIFDYDDAQLQSINARLETATSCPGYPCRVSLEDAPVGATVLLINYEHQTAPSPYRASHAIYVTQGASQATLAADTIPGALSSRLMSVRGFDHEHLMLDAAVVDGQNLRHALNDMFANERVAYIHLHNAKPGCFAAHVSRA